MMYRVSMLVTALLVTTCSAMDTYAQGRRGPLGLTLISLPEVQHELRLTSAQRELLVALQADIMSQRRPRNRTSREERNAVLDKLCGVLLDEPQVKRFAEVKLQFEGLYVIDREDREEFVKEMALTERQLEHIRELRNKENRVEVSPALHGVLEPDQLKKWENRLGKTFAFTEDTLALRKILLQRYDRAGRARRSPPEPSRSQE